MFKVGGYRPSTELLNCAKFSINNKSIKLASNNSSNIHIISEYTPISFQDSTSSCVGNACADALELLKGLEDSNKVEQVSRLFIYFNARNYINEINKDEGCYIHDALDSIKKLGVCRESTWKFNLNKIFEQPSLEAYREGNDNQIVDYYQIVSFGKDRTNDIEIAIRANHPVIFGTFVGSDFQTYTGGDKVFDIPNNIIGGHAMIIAGVRINDNGTRDFWVRNSWGVNFGINGHVWLSENYITWDKTSDIFVPTRMVDFLV